jgi:hypothetical protein
MENKDLLFLELTGRLFPYRDLYENVNSLISQCDLLSLDHNPLIPFGQTYRAPCKYQFDVMHKRFNYIIPNNNTQKLFFLVF